MLRADRPTDGLREANDDGRKELRLPGTKLITVSDAKKKRERERKEKRNGLGLIEYIYFTNYKFN